MDRDERTLDQFRRRLARIEEQVPDPPPLAFDGQRLRLPDALHHRRRDGRTPNLYALLALALGGLVVIGLPYLARPEREPALVPPSAATRPQASARPVSRPTAAPLALTCPSSPILYEGHRSIDERWAGPDWALIEGRLIATEGHLAVRGTRGPYAGPVHSITWPAAFRELEEDGQLVLVDTTGQVVARERDLVMVGGELLRAQGFVACGLRILEIAKSQ